MPRHRLAVSTAHFGQTLRQSIRTAGKVGATGVHLNARSEVRPTDFSATGIRQFLHELAEASLSVASLGFLTRRSFYDQEKLEARVSATKIAMEFARQLQTNVLTVRVGSIPEHDTNEYRLLVDVLNDLARHGNHVGATLCLTPVREQPQRLIELVNAVADGPFGIDFDVGAFAMAGIDPIASFRALHGCSHHVRIRDGLRDIDGGGKEVPLGRGDVLWDELLPVLEESNYKGWLTVERTTGDDRVLDTGLAIQFLRNILHEA